MKKYIPIRGRNRCPIDNTNDGRCREIIDGDRECISCMGFPDAKIGTVINGYKCVKSDSGKHIHPGSFWVRDNSAEWSQEQKEQWEEERRQRQQEQAREEQERLQRSLAALKRHQGYTLLLQQLDRHPDDKKDLLQRGFTEEQIERIGFKSIRRYQRLSINLDPQLPGASRCGSYLLNAHDGYLCPIRNHEGLIIGLQYRLRQLPEGDTNRYRFFSSGSGEGVAVLKLPNGENPIGFYMPFGGKPDGIALVDSLGPKAFLASERLNKIVIGSAGGQFAASPQLFSIYLAKAQEIVGSNLVTIYPDAGDVVNGLVCRKLKLTADLVVDFGYAIEFAWWNQITKQDCDIDELPVERFSEIQYLSPSEFFDLAQGKEAWEGKVSSGKSKSIQSPHALKGSSSGGGASPIATGLVRSCTESKLKIANTSETRLNGLGAIQPLETGSATDGQTSQDVQLSSRGNGESNGDREITKEEYELLFEKANPEESKPSEAEIEERDKDYYIREARKAKLSLKPDLVINQRYLDIKDKLPKAGLICLLSGKDTGKTYTLAQLAEEARKEGKKNINPTHRISLGKALAKRLGLKWVDEKDNEDTQPNQFLSLCLDSLHPYSKARINPEDWKGADLYLDEVEQALKHLFSSSTCAKKRSLIQKTLAEIVNIVLDSGGRIVLCDADLSDFSVNYFRELAGYRHKAFVVVNEFKHAAFPVTPYNTPSPAPMMSSVHESLDKGGRILICTDAQKEDRLWSTSNLERDLKEKYPGKKFIRVDAQTLDDKSSAAWGIFSAFDFIVKDYDGVILSPSCNTGLSIELFNHFDAVFGIFKGVLNAYDIHQFLWRLRDEKVRRNIWVAKRGIGSSEIFAKNILDKQIENLKESTAQLWGLPVESIAPIIESVDPIQHRYYAKFKARDNASKLKLREHVMELLEEHGHEVKLSEFNQIYAELVEVTQELSALYDQVTPGMPEEVYTEIKKEIENLEPQHEAKEKCFEQLKAIADAHKENHKAVKEKSADEFYEAIATAYDIQSNDEAMSLEKVRGLTREEKLALEKFNVKSKYKIDATKELVRLDKEDRQMLLKLKTHYYLQHNPEFLRWRDLPHLESRLNPFRKMEQPPDLDHPLTPQDLRLMSGRVGLVRELGLMELLEEASTEDGVKGDSPQILEIVSKVMVQPQRVERLLGVKAFEGTDKKPMRIVQELLRQSVGLALSRTTGKKVKGKREKIYRFVQVEDDPRYSIFEAWKAEDERKLEELTDERKFEAIEEIALWVSPSDEGETLPQQGETLPQQGETLPQQSETLQVTNQIHQVETLPQQGETPQAEMPQSLASSAIQLELPLTAKKSETPESINIDLLYSVSRPDNFFSKAKENWDEHKCSIKDIEHDHAADAVDIAPVEPLQASLEPGKECWVWYIDKWIKATLLSLESLGSKSIKARVRIREGFEPHVWDWNHLAPC